MSTQPDYSYPDHFDYLEEEINRQPKKTKRAFFINVLIYDNEDNLIRDHKKDFVKRETSKWLHRMMLWALHNGHSIEIIKHARE